MSKHIKLSQGYLAIVDDEDYDLISNYNWYARVTKNSVYAVSNINKTTVQMHRFILNAGKEFMVDHIDRNGLNNTKINLRIASRSQNLMNSKKPKNGKTSKYKGVCLNKQTPNNKKCWRAEIRINRKSHFIGYFYNEKDAAIAYNKKAKELFGDFARLNKI